jgi:hypothetical protein
MDFTGAAFGKRVRRHWERRAPKRWKGESDGPLARPRKATGEVDASRCWQCNANQRPDRLVLVREGSVYVSTANLYAIRFVSFNQWNSPNIYNVILLCSQL